MQTLQCFASSLNDRASLQRLRDSLQEIPKRLLSRLDQPEHYLLGSVSGDYNYHFTFRLEGGGYFQTGVLVASAETHAGGLPVALKCKWRRKIGDLPVEIPGVTSNMYQISADDIGTHICIEAQPADADDGLSGVAIGEIGPFELDPGTRRSLDNALGTGSSRFVASLLRQPGEGGTAGSKQEMAIHATTEGVRIVPLQGGSERSNREVPAEYSMDYPKVLIHPLDTTKFQLIMGDSRSFHLSASSRTSRDLIALTIRCFHARKYISTAQILQDLLPVQPLGPHSGATPSPTVDSRLDACIVLERLTKELNRTMSQKEVSEKVLRNTHHEKNQLQVQLMETISGFTEVIEGLQDQFGDNTSATPALSVERLQSQLREANQQNQSLQGELAMWKQDLEKLQRQRKAAGNSASSAGGGALAAELKNLREERLLLQEKMRELSSSSATTQQRDQADQVHANELKRLRQDVEMLHNQKEQLRRQLQDADRERQELQDNFLYVKGQLDKVQMRQAQAAANPDAGSAKELARHRQTLEDVSEERNRLAMRMEGLLREVEKEKTYHEQSLERVMTANARLLEEKDKAAKEVQRLSQLYSESVQQLQNTSSSGVFRADSITSSSGFVDPDELGRVRAQIAQIDEALQRKEQENESLKNRIRKLAVG